MYWILTVGGERFEGVCECDGGWEIVTNRAPDGTADLDWVAGEDVAMVEHIVPLTCPPPVRSDEGGGGDLALLVLAA